MAERSKDEEVVDSALDRFARTAKIRRLTKTILRAQRVLQRMVSKRAWLAYMKVEETSGARNLEMIDAAIRVGLGEGRSRRGTGRRSKARVRT